MHIRLILQKHREALLNYKLDFLHISFPFVF
uniref:Uncharacterized protein n=1 Tax=Anguilla anguilla TaxID=7936 RepID=A0A0E9PG66_ANGAN